MKTELLPCPFCGMPAAEEEGLAFCDNHKCGDHALAPELWNQRSPALAALQQESERLKKELAETNSDRIQQHEQTKPCVDCNEKETK